MLNQALSTHLGPSGILIALSVAVALPSASVVQTAGTAIEQEIRWRRPEVARVFIEVWSAEAHERMRDLGRANPVEDLAATRGGSVR